MSDAFEPVPQSRTIIMVEGPQGLAGDREIRVGVDTENPLFALDYRNEVGVNQRVTDVDTPVILESDPSGQAGLSFALTQRGTQARLRITATSAAVYTVLVRAKIGGGWRSGRIIVRAT